jgi:hypothetical protein
MLEIAAVVTAAAVAIVIGVCGGGVQRGEQRQVQLTTVRDRVIAGLLSERVHVVVSDLERDCRTHDLAAVSAWREHSERRRALEVASLGPQRLERMVAQQRV